MFSVHELACSTRSVPKTVFARNSQPTAGSECRRRAQQELLVKINHLMSASEFGEKDSCLLALFVLTSPRIQRSNTISRGVVS